MIWESPAYLWFMLIIPLLVVAILFRARQMRVKRGGYFSEELFYTLRKGYWALGHRIRTISFMASFAFLVLAMAGPKVGTEVREVKQRGIDMLIALDLSASMNAEDVRPSRLEKAKFEINRLIERLKGDRVGLVVFTGEAYLQTPMTLDYSALRLFLEISDTDQMPSSATDFSAAMETADVAFESLDGEKSDAARVLLIISDGENHEQEYNDALDELVDDNVRIFTLGIGSEAGTTIPLYEKDTGALIGYKRDGDGKVVTTALQREVLRDIASKGNGSYYEIARGNDGIDAFLARVDELEKGEFSSQEYADFKNQYQWMGALALLSLAIAVLFPGHRSSKES